MMQIDHFKRNDIFNRIFLLFFVYKFFLIYFYLISSLQNFSYSTVYIILRTMMVCDSILVFFSIIMIFGGFLQFKLLRLRIFIFIVSVLTLVLCAFTGFVSAMIISLSGM